MSLSPQEIARMIDLSCVQAQHSMEDLDFMVETAKKYSCICVFSLPAHTSYLIDQVSDREDILVGGVVGFPGGGSTTKMKVLEAKELSTMGCDEIDMVINIPWLKSRALDLVKADIEAVRDAAGKPLKVIFECHHLSDDDIKVACEVCCDAGVTFVKTGTGWAPTGATLDNVSLMKSCVGNICEVKAAGGVRDLGTLLAMVDAGVSRFGIGVKTAISILENTTAPVGAGY
jgi:deoxyribose-phosphate aldolase